MKSLNIYLETVLFFFFLREVFGFDACVYRVVVLLFSL